MKLLDFNSIGRSCIMLKSTKTENDPNAPYM
jgi:hypothetical protein